DLTIFLADRGATVEIQGEYDADLFEPSTIRLLLQHYAVLIDSALEQPGTRVSRLPLMTGEEQARVFTGFNMTSGSFPDEPVWACFERLVRERPDAEAVVCGNARLTYRE